MNIDVVQAVYRAALKMAPEERAGVIYKRAWRCKRKEIQDGLEIHIWRNEITGEETDELTATIQELLVILGY